MKDRSDIEGTELVDIQNGNLGNEEVIDTAQYIPVAVPPPDLALFTTPYLLFIHRAIISVNDKRNRSYIVTITRQSISLCKANGHVKRAQPIKKIFKISYNMRQIIIHVLPVDDFIITIDPVPGEENKIVYIVQLLRKLWAFHHGENVTLSEKKSAEVDISPLLKLNLNGKGEKKAKEDLQDMLLNVRKIDIIMSSGTETHMSMESNVSELIMAKNHLKDLETKAEELMEELKDEKEYLEANQTLTDPEGENIKLGKQLKELKKRCDVLSEECNSAGEIMPALRERKEIFSSTQEISHVLMVQLQDLQKELVQERAERQQQFMRAVAKMSDMYKEIFRRKQNEIDLVEGEISRFEFSMKSAESGF